MSNPRKAAATAQTEIRTALLQNGYVPLPNHDKRCFMKGWSEIMPTQADVDSWSTKLAYRATGMRIEGGVCAIDVDIDNEAIVQRLWDRTVERFPQLREALVRTGKGAKQMWLCRTSEEFSVLFSATYVRPGEDPDAVKVNGHRLEAFGGGHPRQFGVYGAHTMSLDGSTEEITYAWLDDEGPAEIAPDGLPLVSKDHVLAIAEMAREELENAGWLRVTKSRAGEASSEVVYDLTDDMLFDCLDGVRRTLSELPDYALTRNPRCSSSWTGDPTMVNRTRCLVGQDHDGEITVLETSTFARHKAAAAADKHIPIRDKMASLVERMRDAGYEFDDEKFHDAPASFRDIVMRLHDEWAWCGCRSVQCLPVDRHEDMAMTAANLRLTLLPHAYDREGPRGGVQKINPFDAWLGSAARVDVDGVRFMPQHPPGVYDTDGVRAINSYRAPQFVDVARDASRDYLRSVWERFLAHLLPHEDEREWFSDWLAHKFQNPRVPGVAVLMVAKPFGVGRGSLFEICGHLFGTKYVNAVSADNLLGKSTQSQYTEWLADALLVTVSEVLPDGEDGTSLSWRRKQAYEKLKERIETQAVMMEIVRKGRPNYNDWVYASFLMATNHLNALPIPKGDRRICVLRNSDVTLEENPELMRMLNALRTPVVSPAFVSVIASWLQERDVAAFNAHRAPDFTGKRQMLDANSSEFDDLFDDVVDDLPYDWCALDVVMDRVEAALLTKGLRDTYPKWRAVATDAIKSRWHFMGRAYVDEKRSKKSQVLTRTPKGAADFRELDPTTRGEQFREMQKTSSRPDSRTAALRRGLTEATS